MRSRKFVNLTVLAGIVSAAVDPSDPCGKKLLYSGNLTISTQADVDAINKAACSRIGCNLIVDRSLPGLVTFPTITRTDNHIWVGNLTDPIQDSALTGLFFPNLSQANDILISAASGITTLDFPVLQDVDVLYLVNLPNLHTWTGFKKLKRVSYSSFRNVGFSRVDWNSTDFRNAQMTDLYMANNTNLVDINLENLVDVTGGKVEIHGNGASKILLGAESIRYFEVTGCDAFYPGDGLGNGFNELYNISGAREDDGYIRIYNNSFTDFNFPLLKTLNGSIEIHNNPQLINVSFPALRYVYGFLDITDNDQLKVLRKGDLANLRYVSQSVNLTGNYE